MLFKCTPDYFTFHNVSINTLRLHSSRGAFILFTFHNVSINTVDTFNSVVSGISFTFHNVSINTSFDAAKGGTLAPLHSTMFLLIHVRSH